LAEILTAKFGRLVLHRAYQQYRSFKKEEGAVEIYNLTT
jgi:hypothetical protein